MRGQRVILPAKKAKLDLLITSARYHPDNGKLMLAKGFEPVGQVWSDILLLGRVDLIARMKDGERVVNGVKEELAADFQPRDPLRLVEVDGQEFIVAGDSQLDRDELAVPRF